jgi:anti-anti-sigma factor
VKNEKQYEALKDKGMSKERAARIAKSPNASSHGGKKSDLGRQPVTGRHHPPRRRRPVARGVARRRGSGRSGACVEAPSPRGRSLKTTTGWVSRTPVRAVSGQERTIAASRPARPTVRPGPRRTGAIPSSDRLRPGDHVCWTFSAEEEFAQVLTSFTRGGLAEGERILLMLGRTGRDEGVLSALRAGVVGWELALEEGRIVLGSVEQMQTPGGSLDERSNLRGFEAMLDLALEDGCSGLRVFGEATGFLEPGAVGERWAGYELRADVLAARRGLLILCGFDTRCCDPARLELVDAVHGCGLHRNGSTPSPRFRLRGAADGTVALAGAVDLTSADEIGALLGSVAPDLRLPVVDVSELDFADVSGLRCLAEAASELRALHGRAVFEGARPELRRIWSILELGTEDVMLT